MLKTQNSLTLLAALAALSFVSIVSAATVTKDDNTSNLNLGVSWVGGVPPTANDVAVWDGTVTAANVVALGADTNWAGIQILGPNGAVTITPNVSASNITVVASSPTLTYAVAPPVPLVNGDRAYLNGTTAPTGFSFGIANFYYVVNATSTTFQLSATPGGAAITPTTAGTAVNVTGPFLTLGASGIDTSGGSQALNLICPVASTNFDGNAIWNIVSGVTITGGLIGTNTIVKQGGGTLTLANAQSGSEANIQVDAGIVSINVSSGIMNSLNGGTVNLNAAAGNPINVMAGGGIEQNVGGNRTWSGALSGSGPLTVISVSTHTWSGINTNYTGTMTVQGAGALRLSSINAVSAGATYVFNGGTMNANATGPFNLGSLSGASGFLNPSAVGPLVIGALNTDTTFSGVIGSVGNIIKVGTGTLTLDGANTYTGSTIVSNGVLQIGSNGGSGSIASPVVFLTNSTSVLSLNRGDAVLSFTNKITGIGRVRQDGSGTILLSGPAGGAGANDYSGGTVLNAGILKFTTGALGTGGIFFTNGATLQWNSGNTSDISSQTVTLGSGGGTLGVNGNNVILVNPIGNSGPGSLTVQSAVPGGVLNLQGANTYSGGTFINSGTLRANNGSGSATGSGNVTVANGGTLGGGGMISGLVDVSGTLAPGNSVGTLTVGSLTLESSSTNNFEFNSTPANDKVVVTTSSGFTVYGGVFNLYTEGFITPWTTAGTYTLVQYSGADPGLDSSWTTSSASNPHVANPQTGYKYAFTASSGLMKVTITLDSTSVVGTWNVDANGNWSDATKWSSNPNVPHAAGDSSTFGTGTALRTVTLNANETNGAVTMNNNNSFVIADSGKTLTLDNSGSGASVTVSGGTANAIQTAIGLNDNATVVVASGKSLSISGVVSNSNTPKSLAFSGAGTLSLTGNNSYGPAASSGFGTTLGGTGTLQVGNNNALGAGDVSIAANGTLLAGGAGLSVGNNLDLASGVTATVDNNGNNLTLGGVISDSGGLTKNGNGTLTLNGNNNYSGNTTVNAGKLSVSTDANAGSTPNIILNGGGLLGTASFSLNGGHNIGIGTDTGTTGTNALIDAASGQSFQIDGMIASAGNSGVNNLIVNSGAGNNGTLVLNGANTFNGTTVVSNGTLQVLNSLALQNSTLNYSSGNVVFDGNIFAATFGGLSGTNNLALTNLSGIPITLTVGNNSANTTYAGGLTGNELGGALVKSGTGILSLTGTNNYNGTTAVQNGTLEVNGGSLGTSNTLSLGIPNNATLHLTNNGSILVPALDVGTGSGGSFPGAVVIDSGTASFGTTRISSGTINGGYILINGGNVSFGTLTDRRDASSSAATLNQGLIINGGTTTVSNLFISTGNSGADLTISNGSLTIGDSSSIGSFIVGNGTSTARGGFVTMRGGTLANLGTDGMLLNNAATSQGTAAFGGGVAKLTGITLNNAAALTGGNAVLNVNGGSVYLGSIGLVANTLLGGATASITLSSGMLGALADWSSAAPLTLSSNINFQAADDAAVAHNISLTGVLSGAGGLTKTGNGTLTLDATNTYTGNTTVSNGTLVISHPNLSSTSTVTVTGVAFLQLSDLVTNTVAGLVLNGVSQPAGVYNSGNTARITGSGSIKVVILGPTGPGTITNSVSGGVLTLTWPAGQNWRLVSQTNSLSVGLTTNGWGTVSGGIDGSNSIPINANNPTVFYQLVYP